MTDRTVKITYTAEADAVLWDGTQEAWDAILAMDWDDCFLDDQAGTYCVYGTRVTIPLGQYVTFEDRGRPVLLDPSEVTLAPTPPPTPQPGERWVLLEDLGSIEQPVEVVQIAGEPWFAWARDGRVYSERVADRHPSTYRRAES